MAKRVSFLCIFLYVSNGDRWAQSHSHPRPFTGKVSLGVLKFPESTDGTSSVQLGTALSEFSVGLGKGELYNFCHKQDIQDRGGLSANWIKETQSLLSTCIFGR